MANCKEAYKMIKKIKALFFDQLYAISLYSRQIAGTIVLIFLTRILSVHDYGLMRSYGSIITFCLMFANLGFNEYILVSSQNVVKQVQLKIGLFLINAMFLATLIGIGGIFSPLESKLIFILMLLRTFFDVTFFAIILPYYQATRKFNLISGINIFYSIATIIIAIAAYIFKLSLAKFLFLGTLLGIFNFIQCSYFARINYFMVIKHIKELLLKIDKSVFAYSGVTLGFYLYNQLPSVYTSLFTTKEQAALFFAAFSVASIIGLLVSAQTQKMIPEMINVDVQKVKNIIKKNLIFVLSVTSIVFIFMIFLGKLFLQILYGKAYYMNAYPILLILTLANIFIAEGAIFGTYITASGNQKMKIPMMIETSVFTILGLICFRKYNIYGASFALLLAAIYAGTRFTLTSLNLLKKQEEK